MTPLNPKIPLKHLQTYTHSAASPCQTRPVRDTVSQEKKQKPVPQETVILNSKPHPHGGLGNPSAFFQTACGQDPALLLQVQEASSSPAAWSRVSKTESAPFMALLLPFPPGPEL